MPDEPKFDRRKEDTKLCAIHKDVQSIIITLQGELGETGMVAEVKLNTRFRKWASKIGTGAVAAIVAMAVKAFKGE